MYININIHKSNDLLLKVRALLPFQYSVSNISNRNTLFCARKPCDMQITKKETSYIPHSCPGGIKFLNDVSKSIPFVAEVFHGYHLYG